VHDLAEARDLVLVDHARANQLGEERGREPMREPLGDDEERDRDEAAHVHAEVLEERLAGRPRERPAADRRPRDDRQPRHGREEDGAPNDAETARRNEAQPALEPEERVATDERDSTFALGGGLRRFELARAGHGLCLMW
jgi:hypothetical protein